MIVLPVRNNNNGTDELSHETRFAIITVDVDGGLGTGDIDAGDIVLLS